MMIVCAHTKSISETYVVVRSKHSIHSWMRNFQTSSTSGWRKCTKRRARTPETVEHVYGEAYNNQLDDITQKLNDPIIKSEHDKADTYARHLEYRFQLNHISSELDTLQYQPLNRMREKIKLFALDWIAEEIKSNINKNKAHELSQLKNTVGTT